MLRLVGFLGLFGVWEITARLASSPIFPPFSAVVPAFLRLLSNGEAWRHSVASLRSVGLGFLVAAVAGFVAALAMYMWRSVRFVLMPLVDAMRPIAALTMMPLLILAFGLGLTGKVFVICWTAWPAVLLNTMQGLFDVPCETLEAASLDGASRGVILRTVAIPLALPAILTGMRIGMSGGWISLVAAEMLGATAGLGYATLVYSQTFLFPEMYACILLIAGLGLAMNLTLAAIQNTLGDQNYESPFLPFHDRAIGSSPVVGWLRKSTNGTGRLARSTIRKLQGL